MGRGNGELSEEILDSMAEQAFSVLGELKGGAMKVGQALSVFEASMPERYAKPFRESLSKLQAEAPPISAETVHNVLDQQLGTAWPSRFRELDLEAARAASIGQVHRGVWADGRDVAVKVQYPGADEALRSDLRQIRRVAPLLRPFSPGTDIKAVIDEITESATAELDYRTEADNQRAFHAAYADHPFISAPAVLASAPKVVVSEWASGTPMTKTIAEGTAEERRFAAAGLLEFQFSSPTLARKLHGDPHPGNFLIDGDRFIALDFGAVVDLPTGFPPVLEQMMGLALAERSDELLELMDAEGYLAKGADLHPETAMAFLQPFIEPLRSEHFTFSREWMQNIASTYGDVTGEHFRTERAFSLPRRYAMIHRVLGGSVGILCQLETTVDYRTTVEEWMPRIFDAEKEGRTGGSE